MTSSPILVDAWPTQPVTFTIDAPNSMPKTFYPVDCASTDYAQTNANVAPYVVVTPGSPTSVTHTHPTLTLAEDYSFVAYYANYPGDFDAFGVTVAVQVTVYLCTDNAIVVTPDTNSYVYYNHIASHTLDMDANTVFVNIGTGDYASSAMCPLRYEIDPALPPPAYVTIPDNTQPLIDISPATTDHTSGEITFRVKSYYSGYDVDYPAGTVTSDFKITVKYKCTETSLVWDPVFTYAYTVPVG